MNFYCIYDKLYEEFQMPFTMKNDNIAKLEFQMFVDNTVDKAPEKEKQKTRNRFVLCKFDGVEYKPEIAAICIESETTGRMYELHANTMTIGDDE